jgi:hypothetical protein
VAHAPAADVLQRPPQHIGADERAEIADVTARVHRQAAGVHANGIVAQRRKFLVLSGQRVE